MLRRRVSNRKIAFISGMGFSYRLAGNKPVSVESTKVPILPGAAAILEVTEFESLPPRCESACLKTATTMRPHRHLGRTN
jgi:hypothetical protein